MDHQRILALDYGEKRIGVAISDPLGLAAHPLAYIPAGELAMDTIVDRCTEYDVAEIVVGLPKNMNGSESEKSGLVREFAAHLHAKAGRPIVFRDERLSTVAVTKTLIEADFSRKKRKEIVDSQAAAFVLQGYLDYLSQKKSNRS